jgi:hypothetical protein
MDYTNIHRVFACATLCDSTAASGTTSTLAYNVSTIAFMFDSTAATTAFVTASTIASTIARAFAPAASINASTVACTPVLLQTRRLLLPLPLLPVS